MVSGIWFQDMPSAFSFTSSRVASKGLATKYLEDVREPVGQRILSEFDSLTE